LYEAGDSDTACSNKKQHQKGSTFEQVLAKYRDVTNPVTKASYREILFNRLK
jgi:hypothetical protein